jgi:ketosteroid isomerase-like protein
MGHPNEDLIRRGYDAFSRGDMDTLRQLFHPDIGWHAGGRSQLAGDHQGVDTALGFFAKTMELTGGNFRVQVHDLLANDEHAVGLHTAHAERKAGPSTTTTPWCSMSATERSPRSGSTGRTPTPPTSYSPSTALRAHLLGALPQPSAGHR